MTKKVSLETAKLLKLHGFPQEINPGDWYWVILSNGKERLLLQDSDEDNVSTTPFQWFKAAATDELLERLPSTIDNGRFILKIYKQKTGFGVCYRLQVHADDKEPYTFDKSLSEALAAMWFHLEKKNLDDSIEITEQWD